MTLKVTVFKQLYPKLDTTVCEEADHVSSTMTFPSLSTRKLRKSRPFRVYVPLVKKGHLLSIVEYSQM